MSVLQSQNYLYELEGEQEVSSSVVRSPNFCRTVNHGYHLGGYAEHEEENKGDES